MKFLALLLLVAPLALASPVAEPRDLPDSNDGCGDGDGNSVPDCHQAGDGNDGGYGGNDGGYDGGDNRHSLPGVWGGGSGSGSGWGGGPWSHGGWRHCKPGTYACTRNNEGWKVCDAQGHWQYAGHCPPGTHCVFNYQNGSPYCVP